MFNFIGDLIPGNDFISKVINAYTIAMFGVVGLLAGIVPMGIIVIGCVVYCKLTGAPLWTYKA